MFLSLYKTPEVKHHIEQYIYIPTGLSTVFSIWKAKLTPSSAVCTSSANSFIKAARINLLGEVDSPGIPRVPNPVPPVVIFLPESKRQKILAAVFNIPYNIWRSDNIWSSRSEVFCQRDVLKNFPKFIGKYLSWNFLFIKLRPEFLKNRVQQRCFFVKFAKFSWAPILSLAKWKSEGVVIVNLWCISVDQPKGVTYSK